MMNANRIRTGGRRHGPFALFLAGLFTALVTLNASAAGGRTVASASLILPLEALDNVSEIARLSIYSGGASFIVFSPDGKLLASGGHEKAIRLWDVATGTTVNTLSVHGDSVLSVAFSPNGKLLAGSDDKTIRLWDVASGAPVKTLSGHSNSVFSVAFSPDGKLLASGSADKTIRLWSVASGAPVKTLSGHVYSVNSVAFSPDGKLLASGSDDKTVRLWDVAAGTMVKTLSVPGYTVLSVAFSPDGKLLATQDLAAHTVRLWDVATGAPLKTSSVHGSVMSFAFSPDGKLLASGSDDKSVSLWSVASGAPVKTLSGHSNSVFSVAFSPNGKLLASGSFDTTIRLWDIVGVMSIWQALQKDQFETTEEHSARLKQWSVPYSSRVKLGRYDADRGVCEVTFAGSTYSVSVPRNEARRLAASSEASIQGTLKYADAEHLALTNYKLIPGSATTQLAYTPYIPKPSAPEKPNENIRDIPNFKAQPRPNDVAIVIGVENYREGLPKSEFSRSDAGLMKDYLKALGFQERNIAFMTDERATLSDIRKSIETWLPNRVKQDSRVLIYYSGHGAPEPSKGDAYIVPYDGDPNYLEDTGYSLKRLYEKLGKLSAKEVVVLLDACFSGSGGRSVLAKGARPLTVVSEAPAIGPNMAVFTATQGAQISVSVPEKGHGLFTYYFLKALKDGKHDLSEIYTYLKPQVEDEARALNVAQSPSLTPEPEKLKGRFSLR